MAVRRLYVIPLGFLEHDKGILVAMKSGGIVSPIVAYLIETDEGRILYDCGADPDVIDDPKNCWKGITKILLINFFYTINVSIIFMRITIKIKTNMKPLII